MSGFGSWDLGFRGSGRPRHRVAAPAAFLLLLGSAVALAQPVNPYPPTRIGEEKVAEWAFDSGPDGWRAANACRSAVEAGELRIESLGDDPYLHGPPVQVDGACEVRLRIRAAGAGGGQVFWVTEPSPGWDEAKSARFDLVHDDQFHDYAVPVDVQGTLTRLRLDPGNGPGRIAIDRVEVWRIRWHPLEIAEVDASGPRVRVRVANRSAADLPCSVGDRTLTVPAGGSEWFETDLGPGEMFEPVDVQVQAPGFPDLRRTVHLLPPWETLRLRGRSLIAEGLRLDLAESGIAGFLSRDTAPVAGFVPLFTRVRPQSVRFEAAVAEIEAAGAMVRLEVAPRQVSIRVRAPAPVECAVVRVFGPLVEGLFAGLEYLDAGESSSSTLDIETSEHVRFAPDPLKVTMPLMAVATERGWVALTWDDPALQPVFATPNFFDGAPDHRMALRGAQVDAVVRVGDGGLEEAVHWCVKKRGLPPLPRSPRDAAAQRALCLAAFSGALVGEGGWGHCAEPTWPRAPWSDHASTVWRLTGEVPPLAAVAPGGAHVRNDAIWFVTGRAQEWLALRAAEAAALLAEQKPDGSFRYEGPYRRGHSEDTASGFIAQKAQILLEHARATGDAAAREGGLRALEFLKRYRTPRGAQTWELSLHTPDLLAAAHLVAGYVRGFQITGDAAWLAQARAWALRGLPFVYQWSRYPTMAYATVAVYGATNWRAPNWMGLPVQWCGTVYAHALTLLAPHDHALDWRQLAEGILRAAERMQYPDGPLAGCLPDVFSLPDQQRSGPSINPCALVSLRLALDGEVDSLAVTADGPHRVVSPFPVRIEGGKALVKARPGVKYQVLIDGARIVDVESQGEDAVPLE